MTKIEELTESYRASEKARDEAWKALSAAVIEAAPFKVGDTISHTDYWKRVKVVRVTSIFASSGGWKSGEGYTAVGRAFPIKKDGSTSKISEVRVEQKDHFEIIKSEAAPVTEEVTA